MNTFRPKSLIDVNYFSNAIKNNLKTPEKEARGAFKLPPPLNLKHIQRKIKVDLKPETFNLIQRNSEKREKKSYTRNVNADLGSTPVEQKTPNFSSNKFRHLTFDMPNSFKLGKCTDHLFFIDKELTDKLSRKKAPSYHTPKTPLKVKKSEQPKSETKIVKVRFPNFISKMQIKNKFGK